MRKLLLIPALLGLVFIACQKEVKETINQPNSMIAAENQRLSDAITKQTKQTWLNGQVLNENGQAIAGATVNCGGKTATTDSKGFFYFKTILTVNKDYALITVAKDGFMTGYRTFTPNRTKIAYHTENIVLQSRPSARIVPNNNGGGIIADNIRLTFPANSVMLPGGFRYDGNIHVTVRYMDPNASNFPLMIPGTLSGLNDANQVNALQSFGMANVELRGDAGQPLEIMQGKTVKMEMPAAASGPATIPLWHFNETYGIWVQQGSATKQGNYYVAEVNHFSIWNLDIEFNDFELNLRFVTSDSSPVANQMVKVYRPNNVYIKTFFTDNAGEATLINCPSNESLTLKVIFPCDTLVYTLAPLTQTRNETIIANGSGSIVSYQLTGVIRQCNNQPMANQAFQVFLTGPGTFTVLNGLSNASGQFNIGTVLPSCQATTLNAQTTAYFNNQYYFSPVSPIVPGTNNYNPTLCDTTGGGGGGGQFNDSDVVNIPDPSLQQRVRLVINKPSGTIYYMDVKNVTALNASFFGVQTLVGLQFFTSLQVLEIAGNPGVTNINPLAGLTTLKVLDISADSSGGNLADISPLQNLNALEELYLDGNNISNLSALQNKTNLLELHLVGNNISNITPLQGMTQLTELYIGSNQISNVAPLQNLANLQILVIGNNLITTIAPLISGVPALTYFFVTNGNNVPANEITSFQASHPGCTTL